MIGNGLAFVLFSFHTETVTIRLCALNWRSALAAGIAAACVIGSARTADATENVGTKCDIPRSYTASTPLCALESWIECFASARPDLCTLVGAKDVVVKPEDGRRRYDYFVVSQIPVDEGRPEAVDAKSWLRLGDVEMHIRFRWCRSEQDCERTPFGDEYVSAVHVFRRDGGEWRIVAWATADPSECRGQADHAECRLFVTDYGREAMFGGWLLLTGTRAIGDYRLEKWETLWLADEIRKEHIGAPQQIVVRRNGQDIWSYDNHYIKIDSERAFSYPPEFGADITGEGVPNVVITAYTGGAHCCNEYTVLQLGPVFRALPRIEAGDYAATFENLDDDPALEVAGEDGVYLYWKGGYPTSPAPRVILKYRDGEYRPAPDLMREEPPPQSKLDRQAAQIRKSRYWKDAKDPFDINLLRVMLELIYRGNLREAMTFLNRAWPGDVPGKAEFAKELLECQMRHSQYWPTVAAMNGLPVDAKPIGNCPGPQ